MFFFKLKKRFCMRSVDAAWSKVFFLRRVRCGIRLRPAGLRRDKVYFCTRPLRKTEQGTRLPAMRRRLVLP